MFKFTCNGDNSYLFVNGRQIVKCKAKDSQILLYPLCLPGVSNYFSSSNETGLYGHVHDFSVDYKAITNDKIYDINAYLMKKTILHKMFRVMKKILAMIFLASSVNSLKCVLIKNQECKVREVIVNNESILYHSV